MDKKLVQYSVVDAFTDSAFKGNPAAVCLLDEDRDDEWLQAVASEFNLSETCYLTRLTDDDSPIPRFRLRWFTPVAEVELCGHATLAAAHTLFSGGLVNSNIIEFATLSGILAAKKVPDCKAINGSNLQNGEAQECSFVELDFPAVPITSFNYAEISLVHKALGISSVVDMKKTATSDIFVVLPSAKSVTDLQPQFDEIQKCPGTGLIVSGLAPPESGFDFYSRVFYPKFGINEDPVCGSAHCALATYWSQKLGKSDFVAYAASPRSGILNIHFDEQNQRVQLRGKAIIVMEGSLRVLKMQLKCESCQKKVNKVLKKIRGVHSISIATNEGTVAVSCTVDPQLFVAMLAKAGKRSELLWDPIQIPTGHRNPHVEQQFQKPQNAQCPPAPVGDSPRTIGFNHAQLQNYDTLKA